MGIAKRHSIACFCLSVLVGATALIAAPASDAFENLSQPMALGEHMPIEVDADALNYDKAKGRITASGNVVITCGPDVLHADRVLVNMETGNAYALGNVVLKRASGETRARKLKYNFRTRVCSLDDPEVDASPFYVMAEKVTRAGANEYVLHDAKVTTCEFKYPHCHYHLRAKRITVVPGEYMKTWGAMWYFGRVPCFYLPFWRRNLAEDSGFRFYPGYRSKMGAYLLSSYYHRINPILRAEHHLDYRTKRGFAVGEDLLWDTPAANGKLNLYYFDDKEPIDPDEDAETADIDNSRYRIHLQHKQQFNPRTYSLMKLSYVSDIDVLEDFFEDHYRVARQPENYLTVTHRRDWFTVTGIANMRLNDFYSNVNRLPEVSMDIMRLQLGRSSFYYEGQTSIAELERVWADGADAEDYSSFRVDSGHTLYQPRRYFGWLNMVPRAGYRGTYYSDTFTTEQRDVVETTTSTNTVVEGGVTNTVVVTESSTNTVTDVLDAGAQLRNVFGIGAEVSFKAFKMMGRPGAERRHIVEPYANYTFQMEPSVERDELYQFDSVDRLEKSHYTRLGMRNKYQKKVKGRPYDLADIDTYTVLWLDRDAGRKVIERLYMDGEFNPAEWLQFDIDGVYNVEESMLERFNTRMDMTRENTWRVRVEHRYRDEDSSLLSGYVTYYPSSRWAFNAFGRYEFEENRLREQGGYVQRKLDCIGLRLGLSMLPGYTRSDGSERETEYRAMLEFWLTAFPELTLSSKQKY